MSSPSQGLGSPLESEGLGGDIGADLKWTPTANTVIDGTINPDFSQIESDVAQIAANERFALFFPEKRPFFLEGVDLFSTPIQVLYTRTVTAPRWGVRSTGKFANFSYTALVADDAGGGVVTIPGSDFSMDADQDFRSYVGVGRVRREIGTSFVSLLGSARQVSGGGRNLVVGPDFQWRPGSNDTVTGQLLWSDTHTPERPDLAEEWDGRSLRGHAAQLWYSHSTRTMDLFAEVKDFGDDFRADNGFVPQVGFRDRFAEMGYTFRPEGFLRRIRVFTFGKYMTDRDGDLLHEFVSFGSGMDGRWNSFFRVWYMGEKLRAGEASLPRKRVRYIAQVSPGRVTSRLSVEGFVGEEIDFANNRVGTGADVILGGTIRPTDHLELRLNASRRWLDVDPGSVPSGRLFTAQVERLRATYTFTPRMFVRAIGQYVETRRETARYDFAVAPRSASFGASALFAYKLNWQTVLFLGYGDSRTFAEDTDQLEPADRSLFMKISYAFQR